MPQIHRAGTAHATRHVGQFGGFLSTVTGATGDPALAPARSLGAVCARRPAPRRTSRLGFKPTNPNLLFIYCRKTLMGTEMNSFGTRLLASASPLEWRTVALSVP